jgi:hypothetical protein
MTTMRYPGTRWTVYYGSDAGIERFALTELQRGLQSFLQYVVPVMAVHDVPAPLVGHVALVGTAENNSRIAECIASGLIPAPGGAQGYTLVSCPSPWDAGARLLVIAGADAAGVLYGVEELNARLMYRTEGVDAWNMQLQAVDGWNGRRKQLDTMADFTLCETPAIADRGIWSWGYVIYDYRRFLDQMARLKMNALTVWNDHVPLNMPDILDYAHARGVQVTAGFHWGWGNDQRDLSNADDRRWIKQHVLDTYRMQYAHLALDGLYFQTLTEHSTREIAGRSVAGWCCELVNDIAGALFDHNPNLHIQFGLHATAIREQYPDLSPLDERITITWEDAGALPYEYTALTESRGETFASTLAYSRELAAFRPGSTFGICPKGWMCLRWGDEFEHHGPFILGERDPQFLHDRLRARQGEWAVHNARWFRHYPLAARFYRDMLAVNPHLLVTGLVEDGLFELQVQPSVALFAETLWNPHQSDADILERAMRPYHLGQE